MRVQVRGYCEPQFQPLPEIAAGMRPAGSASVTVTMPEVAGAPAALDTAMVKFAPCCPCVSVPLCVTEMVKADAGTRSMRANWPARNSLNQRWPSLFRTMPDGPDPAET